MTWLKINYQSGGGSDLSLPLDPRDMKYVEVISEATGNLFDKTTVTKDGYWDVGGVFLDDYTYVSSNFIPVVEGKSYISKYNIITTFWKEDFSFANADNRLKSFTVPTGKNIKYVRITMRKTEIDEEMFVQGTALPTSYVPYGETPVYKLPSKTFRNEPSHSSIEERHLSNNAKDYIKAEIKDNDLLYHSRGKVPLFIETPLEGYNMPYHPHVVAFDSKWNGYKYWLAYTPFPYAKDGVENPSVVASNDMIKWEEPQGIVNPLDDLSDMSVSYWSDTHLIYRPDLNRLEVWYRGVQEVGKVGAWTSNSVFIARRTTTDGVNWTPREIIHNLSGSGFVSHSAIWDSVNNKYQVWVAGSGGGYFEVDASGTTWTRIGNVTFWKPDGTTFETVWHWDVIKTDVGYECVFMNQGDHKYDIVHYTSEDGMNFRNKQIIVHADGVSGIDKGGFYRPALMKFNGIYYLTYSILMDELDRCGITLSIASRQNDILSLKGIDASHQLLMARHTRKSKWASEGTIIFDRTLNKTIVCTSQGTATVDAEWRDMNGTIV